MNYQPFTRTLIATALVLTFSGVQAASQAPVAGENGMVVTAQHLATHVGVDVLKAGGNAVDAAVAAALALAAVEPWMCGLGGSGFRKRAVHGTEWRGRRAHAGEPRSVPHTSLHPPPSGPLHTR